MSEIKPYIQKLFNANGINVSTTRQVLFEEFVKATECEEAVNTIVQKQNQIMEKWRIQNRIADIIARQVVIPNATIGKVYEAKIDFQKLNLTDLIFERFEGLEEMGLKFNSQNDTVEGTPTKSGDVKIKLFFKIKGQS
jgi:CTP synthase (UTP-ammonia lyase)